MAVVLPYLEREPLVKYKDENNIIHSNEGLTNDICGKEYEILERFGYSWVSEFNIECDKFNIGLIGVFTFIGNTMGSIVFSIITKYLSHKITNQKLNKSTNKQIKQEKKLIKIQKSYFRSEIGYFRSEIVYF